MPLTKRRATFSYLDDLLGCPHLRVVLELLGHLVDVFGALLQLVDQVRLDLHRGLGLLHHSVNLGVAVENGELRHHHF